MNDSKQNMAPWDEGYYQTGALTAPRRRGGLVLVLMVAVVLLGGIITILGLLNIRLFVALKQQEKKALQLQNASNAATDPSVQAEDPEFSMDLSSRPGDIPTQQEIYSGCIDALVNVRCGGTSATGVVVDARGYIVTNRHAVMDSEQIYVRLSNQRQYTASLVGTDSVSDLAVLRIAADNLTAAVFGDSGHLQVGDAVCAIGDPLGTDNRGTMTNGTVSAIDDGTIHTDALSGPSGPLLDRYGYVVGIGTSLGTGGEVHAIPSAMVKTVVEQLVCQGYVSGRPWLGILCEPMSERYQHYYDVPAGLYVTEVLTRTAGSVLKNGDILLELDGYAITDSEELSNLLCSYRAGDRAIVTILRDDSRLMLAVTIEEARGG